MAGLADFFAKLLSPSPSTPVQSVSVKDAFDMQKSQRALIVDVRTPAEHRETGIPKGAIALPLQDSQFGEKLTAATKGKHDRPVVLICRSGQRAGMAAKKAAAAGFENLSVVRGGVAGPGGWVQLGLPTKAP